MKKYLSLLFLTAIAFAFANAAEPTLLWELKGDKVPAWGDVRQGWGMDQKFYINDKAQKKVLVYDENGLTEDEIAGGPDCGIALDEAGNILVSLSEFPGAFVCNGEDPMFRVINPATGETAEFAIPADAANDLAGRQDVIGWAKGNLFDEGEIYITTAGMDTGKVYRLAIVEGAVDEDNSYAALIDGICNRDNMSIVSYSPTLEKVVFYYRATQPVVLEEDGDGFVPAPVPALPATDGGNVRSNSNHDFLFMYNEELYCLYTVAPAIGKYFDGFALAKLVEEEGDEAPVQKWEILYEYVPTVEAAPNSCQGEWLNAEVDETGFYIYQYVPGLAMRVFRYGEEPVENKFYIAGTFTDWQNGKLEMAEDEDGTFSITIKGVENEAQFKFIDQDGVWYGGNTGGNEGNYGVHKDWCTDIDLLAGDEGRNFQIALDEPRDLTFSITDGKLTVTGWEAEEEPLKVYALTHDAAGNWDTTTGTELAFDEADGHYRGEVTLVGINPADAPMLAEGAGKAYLGFTTILGEDWEAIAAGRFGPVSNGNFVLEDQYLDQPISLTGVGEGDKFFEMAPGKYGLDVDLEGKVIKISDLDPTGIKDLNGGKVVANVKYVNMAGIQADEAFEGVNVMVITYKDGTKKAVKVVK